MNRADRRAQFRSRFCRGGTPWPPPVRNTPSSPEGRPRSAAPTIVRQGSNRSIALHIGELVLHGFPVQGRHAVGDAVQAELTRMLSTGGLPEFVANVGQTDALDGGSFRITPHAKPNAVGSLIAKAVYGGRRR